MNHFAQRNHCCYNLKKNVLNDGITSRELAIGITFFLQTMVGIWGNFSFLYHTQYRLRATGLICKHLTIANSLVILSNGVPQVMTALGLKQFFNDFACKLLLYLQRMGKGMSMGSTCLLCVFQTITVSPVNSCWKDLKVKAPKYIGFFISLCWIQFTFVNLIFPMYSSGKWNSTNITKKTYMGYCVTIGDEKIIGSLYAAWIVFPEVSFSVLIVWASGSMVFTLYRHSQRVQYLHRTNRTPRSSAKAKATHSILVLASTFICFHTLSSICHIPLAFLHDPSWWLVNTAALSSMCFPSISPFLLMSRASMYPGSAFCGEKTQESSNHFRKV